MNNQMHANDQSSGGAELSYVGSATQHRLPQPGGRPNVFQGTELAMAMSFTPSLPYWYEINLYRTNDQGFAVAIRKFFQSEEETDWVKSWMFSSAEAALSHIEGYDASADVRVTDMNFEDASPAELAAKAMLIKAEVESARSHFAGLVGEMFAEIEAAGTEM